MQNLKVDIIFLRVANDYMVEDYHIHSRATTNIGQRSSFLELEDKYDEEVVDYF